MKLFVLYHWGCHGGGVGGALKLNQFFRLFEKVGIRGFFDFQFLKKIRMGGYEYYLNY
jgi:hypothetical protein